MWSLENSSQFGGTKPVSGKTANLMAVVGAILELGAVLGDDSIGPVPKGWR